MSETWTTSTGHMASEAAWLDHHFESARAEYEEALRFLGIKPGWLRFLAARSAEQDIPQADREALGAAAADPDRLLNDPDFCFREAFIVTSGQVLA